MVVCWHSHQNSVTHGRLLTFPSKFSYPWQSVDIPIQIQLSMAVCWHSRGLPKWLPGVESVDSAIAFLMPRTTGSQKSQPKVGRENKKTWRWVILHDSWLVRPVQCPVHVLDSCSSYYSFSRQAEYAAVCSKAIRLPRAACPSAKTCGIGTSLLLRVPRLARQQSVQCCFFYVRRNHKAY